MNGSGMNYAELEYLPKNNLVKEGHIAYTSGSDGVFSPGIPIGKVKIRNQKKTIKFFSDLDQLNFVKIRHINQKKQ